MKVTRLSCAGNGQEVLDKISGRWKSLDAPTVHPLQLSCSDQSASLARRQEPPKRVGARHRGGQRNAARDIALLRLTRLPRPWLTRHYNQRHPNKAMYGLSYMSLQ